MRIEDIDRDSLIDTSEKELYSLRLRFIQLWSKSFKGNKKQRAGSLHRQDFLDRYIALAREMRSREMTMNTSDIDGAAFKKSMFAKKIGLDISGVGDKVIIPDFVSIAGSFVVDKSKALDMDVVIRTKDRDESTELLLKRAIGKLTDLPLRFIYSAFGPHSSYIPLFDLVIRKKGDTEIHVVKSDHFGDLDTPDVWDEQFTTELAVLVKELHSRMIDKGSSTSGNYGHEGRPGEVGGSQSGGGGGGSKTPPNKLSSSDKGSIESWLDPDISSRISHVDTGDLTDKESIALRDDFYRAIDKLPSEQLTAYRGTRIKDEDMADLEVGDVIVVKHVSSYADDEGYATEYTSPGGTGEPIPKGMYPMVITADLKSAKGIGDFYDIPGITPTSEVVISKGTKLKVTSTELTSTGTFKVSVKEI